MIKSNLQLYPANIQAKLDNGENQSIHNPTILRAGDEQTKGIGVGHAANHVRQDEALSEAHKGISQFRRFAGLGALVLTLAAGAYGINNYLKTYGQYARNEPTMQEQIYTLQAERTAHELTLRARRLMYARYKFDMHGGLTQENARKAFKDFNVDEPEELDEPEMLDISAIPENRLYNIVYMSRKGKDLRTISLGSLDEYELREYIDKYFQELEK